MDRTTENTISGIYNFQLTIFKIKISAMLKKIFNIYFLIWKKQSNLVIDKGNQAERGAARQYAREHERSHMPAVHPGYGDRCK